MKNLIVIVLAMFVLVSCNQAQNTSANAGMEKTQKAEKSANGPFYDLAGNELQKVKKSEDEWKSELSKEQYYVIREDGTERSFTSDLLNEKREGVFTCAACSLPLFTSETKFKSGTGWPSYYQPINDSHVADIIDSRYGMKRVEVECGRCGGHLGHVFEDGPAPTGLRYCINGVSLDFEPIKLEDVKKP